MKNSALNSKEIALIGPKPPPNGGMALQALQLKLLLEQEGYHITYVSTNESLSFSWISNTQYIRAIVRFFFYCFSLMKVPKNCNVWHIFSNSGLSWFLFSLPAICIGRLRGNYIVVNYRGGGADKFLEKWHPLVKFNLKWANSLVVPSVYLKEIFKKYGILSKIVPNIIDDKKFNASERKVKKTLQSHTDIVLSITRNLEAIYGIDVALHAFKIAREVIPQLKLFIAGEGIDEGKLKDLADALGVKDSIQFLGRLSQPDIIKLYQKTDILINPSFIDNMPNSLLEAMACRVPIITTNAGGIPYLVEHLKTAWMVPISDQAQLSEAIIEVVRNDQLRQALSNNAYQQSQYYFWPQVKKAWHKIYQKGWAQI